MTSKKRKELMAAQDENVLAAKRYKAEHTDPATGFPASVEVSTDTPPT